MFKNGWGYDDPGLVMGVFGEWLMRLNTLLHLENHSILILFDEEGTVSQIFTKPKLEALDRDLINALKASHPAWFLYDPFDMPEWFYIGWSGLKREWVERLTGKKLPDDTMFPESFGGKF